MSQVEDRLAELGLTVPEVAAPVASYVPAVISGNYVYTSGQLPMVAGTLAATGRLGAEIDQEEGTRLAEICALNAIAAVKSVLGDLDRVVHVVRVTGFVSSIPEFHAQPAVINGASNLLGTAFNGAHSRSAVGVAALPLNAPVEVDMIVEFK
ncbi:MAG: RidA family protein [Candidatus Nanopelagicales bacterium]|nr:RidA family protein [Candidatus Nanopelagicales bacterium]MCF8538888.1 RidA family protein [Candidatus Nanopelagicales bacterium]MCF8551357.1 RidA family protein [Candidatus Nanopelagicales bacterium]